LSFEDLSIEHNHFREYRQPHPLRSSPPLNIWTLGGFLVNVLMR
jgi:hypothetical protein